MIDFSAIIFDIDGTLLNSQGRILDTTRYAIHKCAQKGVVFYVATARPKRLVFRPLEIPHEEINFLTRGGAFYNGAVAIDESFSYYRHWSIPAETVHSITDDLEDTLPDLNIAIQSEDKYHSYRLPMDDATIALWGFSRDELLSFSQARNQSCSKIVVWHETEDLSEIYAEIHAHYAEKTNIFITDSFRWIQIMDRNATKENALLELLSIRNIPPQEVVVFGDDIPDMGMFKTFKYSVAMENAPAALKETATFITRSNNNDGIAYALEKFFGVL